MLLIPYMKLSMVTVDQKSAKTMVLALLYFSMVWMSFVLLFIQILNYLVKKVPTSSQTPILGITLPRYPGGYLHIISS